ACSYSWLKYPGRAPTGHALLRAVVGPVDGDPAVAAHAELARILGISGGPLWSRAFSWPRGVARYRPGHAAHVAAVLERLATPPLAAEHDAAVAHPATPRLRARGLDGAARAHARWDHGVAVLPRLSREQLHRRHAHRARGYPFGREPLVGAQDELHLGAARDQENRWLAALAALAALTLVRQHVRAESQSVGGSVAGAVDDPDLLAREHK